ncbi:MAG: hypothetical protein HUK22_08500, partial [Thermoguttaceae bacterium]|nr:hypothetical protein [Thermoguttaceae bacterium]
MTKSSDNQNNRGGRRRPSGKSFISRFQWDSVDNQEQEDLIVPSAAPSRRKAAKAARRRDKDVGTMYVSTNDDLYAMPKRKPHPERRLEDVPEFVADVDEGEEDAFATPSYGRTKLTPDDEELVEELVAKPERPAKAQKRGKICTCAKAEEGRLCDGHCKDGERRCKDKDKEKDKDKRREKCAKRERRFAEEFAKLEELAVLAQIKEAFADARKEACRGGAEPLDLEKSFRRARDAKRKAKAFLDVLGAGTPASFADCEATVSLEELADLIDALVAAGVKLALFADARGERKEGRPTQERETPRPRENGRRGAESIFDDESAPTPSADVEPTAEAPEAAEQPE